MVNKKAQIGILYFSMALAVALFLAFMISIGVALIDWTADTTLPEVTNLGTIGDVNFTKTTDVTLVPLNSFIQALPLVAGIFYVILLIGCLGLAYAFRMTQERWLLFMFFGLLVILTLLAMTISIIYEDLYDDLGDLGDRLREQSLLSFLIIYSPAFMIIIGVIGALIMFTDLGGVEV